MIFPRTKPLLRTLGASTPGLNRRLPRPPTPELARAARKIVPDCPLALWGEAGALHLLDRNKEAKNLYLELIGQAVAQVKARGLGNWEDDCWEGVEWTFSLLTDCYYRIGVCYQDMNDQDSAITFFKMFIGLRTRWTGGIYTVGDALVRLEAISPVDREDFGRIVEAEVAATLR